MPVTTEQAPKRFGQLALWLICACALFWKPLQELVHYSLQNDNASHTILIPFLAAFVLYLERAQVFSKTSQNDWKLCLVFVFFSATFAFAGLFAFINVTPIDALALKIAALVFLWIAGVALVFGRSALRNGRFAFLFLFLTIPLPNFLLNRFIYILQKGAADLSAVLFDLTGVPYLREGFVFHLPSISIEVARECSGIRSSIALFILALLIVHFCLRTFWKQALFVAFGLAMMILKNGVRIVTLTLLSIHVNPGFLFGKLHHEGGIVFFLAGLALLLPVLWLLQRSETRGGMKPGSNQEAAEPAPR